MKLRRIYNIIINDIVYAATTDYKRALKLLDAIKKAEPKAHIEIYYA
ncbi:MAG: hypothetical protein J6Y02_15210 [Pseudobutyrivibrio sp.]|nr:hypothetical protein [Pseudobutyrivibrio sp.]